MVGGYGIPVCGGEGGKRTVMTEESGGNCRGDRLWLLRLLHVLECSKQIMGLRA